MLYKSTTLGKDKVVEFTLFNAMEPRVALDKTIKFFKLKAVDISRNSGVDRFELSKYRRGHKDMGSVNVFKVVNALPIRAKLYFFHLCVFNTDADFDYQKCKVQEG